MASSAAARFALLVRVLALPDAAGVRDSFDSSLALALQEDREAGGFCVTVDLTKDFGMMEFSRSPETFLLDLTDFGCKFGPWATVTEVKPGSTADLLGIRQGWKLEYIDEFPIRRGREIRPTLSPLFPAYRAYERAPGQRTEVVWKFATDLRPDSEEEAEEVWRMDEETATGPDGRGGRPAAVGRLLQEELDRRVRASHEWQVERLTLPNVMGRDRLSRSDGERRLAKKHEAQKRLETARSSGELEELRRAIEAVEGDEETNELLTGRQGDVRREVDPVLEQARTSLKRMEDRRRASKELRDAAGSKDVERLRSALSNAEKLLISDEDFVLVRDALQRLEAESVGELVVTKTKSSPAAALPSLGLDVRPTRSGQELQVVRVVFPTSEGKIVPDMDVGDVITAVNGKRGCTAMRRELDEAEKVMISFKHVMS